MTTLPFSDPVTTQDSRLFRLPELFDETLNPFCLATSSCPKTTAGQGCLSLTYTPGALSVLSTFDVAKLYTLNVEERVAERRKNGEGVKVANDLLYFSTRPVLRRGDGLTLGSWYRCPAFSSIVRYWRPTTVYLTPASADHLASIGIEESETHTSPSAEPVNTIPPSPSQPTVQTASA